MTEGTDVLHAARRAFEQQRWDEARAAFESARDLVELGAEDLAALAECAWWQGDVDECLAIYEEAYRLYLHGDAGGTRQAGKLATELAFFWYLRGEGAIASGWISRARRLLEGEPDCAEKAYLRAMGIDEAMAAADFDTAIEIAAETVEAGHRYGDETLTALGLASEGIALVKRGDVAHGLAALDEAMLPVIAGKVEPAYAGNIYCQLMRVCHELADFGRARQWTDATTRWCEGFPDAVMFLGICRVHRAQLMQIRGDWAQAEEEALRLCDELASMNVDAVGQGYYELGEVRRQRGDLTGAEEAYARAHELGRDPQPGFALLRLAQGRVDAATQAIAGVVATAVDPLLRARLRDAQVEIALAAGDLTTAEAAAAELAEAASRYASPGFVGAAAQAQGAVALARGDHEQARQHLDEACRGWRDIGARHRTARVRVLLARNHRATGNHDAAERELSAAGDEFERLGARLDAEHVRSLHTTPAPPDGLTAREVEVLRLVAAGLTNKQVAEALSVSEKTVARHLSNMFTKLDVSSRTAAAAYAHEQGLASRG